tara:strand:- start:277 stop:660 length:384 start_codon:yes stop_codon:yes gene_type:complete
MDIKKKSSNKSFGIVFFIFFTIISLYPLFVGGTFKFILFIVGLIFLILGVFNSQILTPLNIIWIKFGILLGKFISPLVMLFIFFIIVTPIGLIMKIFKKDSLGLKKNNSKTYWVDKPKAQSTMKDQF